MRKRTTVTGEDLLRLAKRNGLQQQVRDRQGRVTLAPLSPAAPVEPKRSEHDEQVALFQWAADNLARYPMLRWMHANPNGGHRHPAVAGKMKAEGVKRGVLDIYLLWPTPTYGGLAIEMKVGSNKPTKEQAEMIDHLRSIGWRVAVCYSAKEGQGIIELYLSQTGT